MYDSIDTNRLDKAGRFALDDIALISYQSADGSNQNPKSVDFNEIKTEIKSFITINIFSLLCKL